MTLMILFLLKTMESLQIGDATNFLSNSVLFNENSIADADAWCKQALKSVATGRRFVKVRLH